LKLLVFGATGPTGRHLVSQALEQGHEVTAFARQPEAIAPRERLRVLQGDTTRDAAAVAAAIRGKDAIVSALGVGNTFFPNGLMQRSLGNIVPAMEREGVKRLVLMSAFGVGASKDNAPLIPRIMYCTLLSGIFADKQAAEDELRASALDWTIVYPVLLTSGPATGRYRAGERLELHGVPTISRADVAHFMLGEISRPQYLRKAVALSY
jgi:putative NADH-flavin reductase